MSYSTSAEVQSDFKNLPLTTSTLVTLADVDQFIIEADALINSFVGMKYVVPVVGGSDALSLLKLFSRTLVADRIKKIMEVKQVTNGSANQETRGAYGTKDVMAALKQIQNGDLKLSGAEQLTSGGGFYSENSSNNVKPVFKKDCKQW